MKVRLLHTTGQGSFEETIWDKPEPTDDEIEVRAIMTGICRSDIEMMKGEFGPLLLSMQGHEGLGQVTKVGANLMLVKVGDYVATRGEPAYADYYNVRKGEFVVVPSAEPKYILEPVACGINVITQPYDQIKKRSGKDKRCLILGSGFLSWVVYNAIQQLNIEFESIDVVGSHNKELWKDKLSETYSGSYDVVIDLSNRDDILDKIEYNNEALLIMGVQKEVSSDYGNMLWKACTIVFPSPRAAGFIGAMGYARLWVSSGELTVDNFWTRGYSRDNEWQQAFEDALNRPKNYSRGYIKWD